MVEHEITAVLTQLTSQVQTLNRDMSEIRDAMKDVAKAMNRLALAEERIAQVNEALGRAFKQIDAVNDKLAKFDPELSGRVMKLELNQPLQKQAQTWVQNAVWAAVVLVGMFAAKKLGLM